MSILLPVAQRPQSAREAKREPSKLPRSQRLPAGAALGTVLDRAPDEPF